MLTSKKIYRTSNRPFGCLMMVLQPNPVIWHCIQFWNRRIQYKMQFDIRQYTKMNISCNLKRCAYWSVIYWWHYNTFQLFGILFNSKTVWQNFDKNDLQAKVILKNRPTIRLFLILFNSKTVWQNFDKNYW